MSSERQFHATVHVGAPSLAEAQRAAADVIGFVSTHVTVLTSAVAPYPKFDDQYAVTLALDPAEPEGVVASIKAAVGGEWTGDSEDEPWAIWDVRLGGPAPVPAMRWVHLQVFTANTTTVRLSDDEALVLFERLSAWQEAGDDATIALDPADVTAFNALQCLLERELDEPFMADYAERLASARARLAD